MKTIILIALTLATNATEIPQNYSISDDQAGYNQADYDACVDSDDSESVDCSGVQ